MVKTFGEPSGGTHLSLVIAGALGIPFESAESLKCDPANHPRLLPIVEPVLEKLATIVSEGVADCVVPNLVLVGGTCGFNGLDQVMRRVTGIPCVVAPEPLLVTPLGVAEQAEPHREEGRWTHAGTG